MYKCSKCNKHFFLYIDKEEHEEKCRVNTDKPSSIIIRLKDNAKKERIDELKKDLHKLNQVSVMDNFGAYRDIIKSIEEEQ